MATADIKAVSSPYSAIPTFEFRVEDRTTSSASATIKPGEPIKIRGGQSGNDVVILATGDPEDGTDIVAGIAAKESTETSSADGVVEAYLPLQGIVWRCAAHTGGNLASGILYDCVTFDLTNSTFTINEDEGSDENGHGLRIMDYDTDTDTIDFIIKDSVTIFGDQVA